MAITTALIDAHTTLDEMECISRAACFTFRACQYAVAPWAVCTHHTNKIANDTHETITILHVSVMVYGVSRTLTHIHMRAVGGIIC